MNKEELVEKAIEVIKIGKLRAEIPDLKSRKKEDYIDYLFKNNKDRLEYLVNYYTFLKTRSVFFSYSKKKLNFNEIENKRIVDKDSDHIFEFQKAKSQNNIFIINIKAHSRTYEYPNVEEPETLIPISVRFRKPFTIYFSYHTDTSILEIRTRSLMKFEYLKILLKNAFNLSDDDIVLIKMEEKEYKKIDENMRYRSVTAKGLNIAGADEISINGDDVEKTLDYLKEKTIDIRKLCSTIIWQKVDMSEKPITFLENGKITFRPTIKDIYEELKGVLLEHVNKIK